MMFAKIILVSYVLVNPYHFHIHSHTQHSYTGIITLCKIRDMHTHNIQYITYIMYKHTKAC